MFVHCAFRIHPQGEILLAYFDTEIGRVSGYEELFQVDMTKVGYCVGNYSGGKEDNWRRLYTLLIKDPQLVAAIGYNCIGALLVTRSYAGAYIYLLESYEGEPAQLLKPFKRITEVIGEVKTKVETYAVRTPQAALVVDKTDCDRIVYTRLGKVRLDAEYDSIQSGVPINMSMHSTLLKHEDWYAICTSGGVLTPLMIRDGRMFAVPSA